MARILIILPAFDFDPSEAAIVWQIIKAAGHEIVFSTPQGLPSIGDELMLSGRGLDIWGFIPFLRNFIVIGNILRANKAARNAYNEMVQSHEFMHPTKWELVKVDDFDGFFVPGGHKAQGMRPFLESQNAQNIAVEFFTANKPVGSVCHGPLLLARAIDPKTGKSVLFGRKTTALTWDLEKKAALLGNIVRFWDRNYYRTYPEAKGQKHGQTSTQNEIENLIGGAQYFVTPQSGEENYTIKTNGLSRDSLDDMRCSFVVKDGNYVSARWPGDIHALGLAFCELLK